MQCYSVVERLKYTEDRADPQGEFKEDGGQDGQRTGGGGCKVTDN